MNQNNKALALGNPENVKTLIADMKDNLLDTLPEYIKPDDFLRMALVEVTKNPGLLECTQESFIGAMLTATQEGLQIGSSTGECWVIPYYSSKAKRKEAQYQRGYKGLYKLAQNTGLYKIIDVDVIREKDPRPTAKKGSDFCFAFEPDYFEDDRGRVIAYYCYTELLSGERDFTIMTVKKVEEHRQKYSKQPNSPAWKNNFDAMAKKTVFTQHMQFKPKTTVLAHAMNSDDKTVNYDFKIGSTVIDDDDPNNQLPAPKNIMDLDVDGDPNVDKDYVLMLKEIVDDPGYKRTITGLIRDGKIPTPSQDRNDLRTDDQAKAKEVFFLIVKYRGFELAAQKEAETEPEAAAAS
ncbi:MAG: hypothetical protein GY866_38180 [Proteobacteria bacterium]|nr:hypothetical protein [Pseudomonadota bacterium]